MWCWWTFRYKNCKCRKRLIDKLVEECSENIDVKKLLSKKNMDVCSSREHSSCTVYIVLFSVFLTINIGIGALLVHKNDNTRVKFNTNTQTINYWMQFHWVQLW